MEIEKNKQLLFLDVLVHKLNGLPKTTVYKKLINTERYLHNNINTKVGVAMSLNDRTIKKFLNTDRNEEFKNITKFSFKKYGYLRKVLNQSHSNEPILYPSQLGYRTSPTVSST